MVLEAGDHHVLLLDLEVPQQTDRLRLQVLDLQLVHATQQLQDLLLVLVADTVRDLLETYNTFSLYLNFPIQDKKVYFIVKKLNMQSGSFVGL